MIDDGRLMDWLGDADGSTVSRFDIWMGAKFDGIPFIYFVDEKFETTRRAMESDLKRAISLVVESAFGMGWMGHFISN